jgi:hypothetical protein
MILEETANLTERPKQQRRALGTTPFEKKIKGNVVFMYF